MTALRCTRADRVLAGRPDRLRARSWRAEIVGPARLSATALAERLHVTRQAASNLLNGNAGLSAETGPRRPSG